ncbi:hypothetical protein NQ318_006811 [Aromia moschata]|uniref:Uncharacterized protein n=1 Tax=Aromia moschata TaxID=1265417 RepID=A0AAV8XQ52_9CUCU|nr:hypothetical protein NQ318_006811 [Aromia moschata]
MTEGKMEYQLVYSLILMLSRPILVDLREHENRELSNDELLQYSGQSSRCNLYVQLAAKVTLKVLGESGVIENCGCLDITKEKPHRDMKLKIVAMNVYLQKKENERTVA